MILVNVQILYVNICKSLQKLAKYGFFVLFGICLFLAHLHLACVNVIQTIWDVCSGPYRECPNLEEILGKSWPDTGLEDVIHGT